MEGFPKIIFKKRGCKKLKIKKRPAMLLSLALGTVMFATTALAEVASKSGYEQAKDAMKYTADSLTSKLTSYTADVSLVVKDNGNIVASENSVNKYDLKALTCENVTTSTEGSNKTERYFFRDKNSIINFNPNDGVYYVSEYRNDDNSFWVKNPFKEKEAGDIEKIADALIGNLKDYVVSAENADGSKELSGSLSEAQIPAIVNAVASFQFKQAFSYRGNPNEQKVMPKLTEDIFVKEVTGKMDVDKNGLVHNVLGTGKLVGKDEQGKEHNLTFELLMKVSNINSTVVNKPDLAGKKVQESNKYEKDIISNPQIYTGTYKNNIVIKKDGKFEKIGERILEIEQIDSKTISGRYHEQYLKGFESYAENAKNFKLDAKFEQFPHNATFSYTTPTGKSTEGNISLDNRGPRLYLHVSAFYENDAMYDGNFERVFE
jgi:hypothetical protein